MKDKVKVLVLDRDLKGRTYKKFEVSEDGSKIRIKSGGKAHFMPTFDNDSFIEIPRRSLIPPFKIVYDRLYIVRNLAKSCFRFRQRPNDLTIKSEEELRELLDDVSKESPDPERIYQLNEVLGVLETAGQDDFLKPDPETVVELAQNEIAKGLGADPKPDIQWYVWIQLGLIIFLTLLQLGVL